MSLVWGNNMRLITRYNYVTTLGTINDVLTSSSDVKATDELTVCMMSPISLLSSPKTTPLKVKSWYKKQPHVYASVFSVASRWMNVSGDMNLVGRFIMVVSVDVSRGKRSTCPGHC